ncbi:vitamin B12 dependent-methionine synthase activation domain-containing protein [Desulfofalx alkaliphila]|uniref:vitamin B12 dependent-methionine synthase activation domain-containing protein n=1 Tax=Desulfofalx alkaliphila TaxID=105483 RepID=UPI0004E26B55|nr:vitamin B12 dependent-methionine synthase activation domain-containing protein [Desulfofalx alkaliphila]
MYIDKDQVLRYLGYKPESTRYSQQMLEKIDYYILLGTTLLEPNTTHRIFNRVHLDHRGVLLQEADLLLPGKDISDHLRYAKKVCIVAATIGPQLEAEVSKLFKQGEYAAGTILDAVGTDAVEKVADRLQESLKASAMKQGYKLTWRFCSGYGDFPVTVQPQLLKAVNAQSIGITVTDSCMLLPQKSIIGVVGFTPGDMDTPVMDKCSHCQAENCAYRNRGDKCAKTTRNDSQ